MIFYIDSIDFNTATSVYEDAGFLRKAPDGYYSISGIYRRQVFGKLTNIETCPIPVPPIFDQVAPQFTGSPGDIYTYTGTVSDPDHPSDILIVSSSSLPPSWTLVQTPGTNTFTISGPVPAGADYSVTLQVNDLDTPSNTAQQTLSVNSIFATLSSMEFKINFRAGTIAAGTGSSHETTSPINISASPLSGSHTCNRAQFNLVVGIYANINGGEWQWTNLGKASLNNGSTLETYNLFDDKVTDVAKLAYGSTVPNSWLNIAAGKSTDLNNLPIQTFIDGNTLSYYNVGTPGSGDRTNYFKVLNTTASDLAIASNWGGSANTNRGIVKFKLVANTYNDTGVYNPHDGDFGWMQIFKKNSLGNNQEEVLNNQGGSFVMSGSVVVTVNIIQNDVSVGIS